MKSPLHDVIVKLDYSLQPAVLSAAIAILENLCTCVFVHVQPKTVITGAFNENSQAIVDAIIRDAREIAFKVDQKSSGLVIVDDEAVTGFIDQVGEDPEDIREYLEELGYNNPYYSDRLSCWMATVNYTTPVVNTPKPTAQLVVKPSSSTHGDPWHLIPEDVIKRINGQIKT